jgi:hypothetical protein
MRWMFYFRITHARHRSFHNEFSNEIHNTVGENRVPWLLSTIHFFVYRFKALQYFVKILVGFPLGKAINHRKITVRNQASQSEMGVN